MLSLRDRSFISAQAGGTGNGGNVIINAPIILGLENSDIIANAVQGRGGTITITITTQGIIGLAFRNTLTPRIDLTNDITASSQFSINGNVNINTIGIAPNAGLVSLPMELKDSSGQMADRCATANTNSFISTGRGGIPKKPIQINKAGRTWNDFRNIENDRSPTISVLPSIVQAPTAIVEASALQTNPDGSIELVAPMQTAIASGATCAIQ